MSGRLKKLTISEGVVVVSATEEGTSTTSYAQYASDAEYELNNASFGDGAVYYNTATDTIRIYSNSTWQDLITVTALTASRALISDGSGDIAVSTVTSTELGYISGLGSSAQAQINNKISSSSTDTLTNKTINGSSNTISNISLTSSVTGTLPATNGGTGSSSFSKGDILYASSSTSISKLPIGSDGQILVVSTDVPAWASISTTIDTKYSGRYYKSSSQAFSGTSPQVVIFDASAHETHSMYNTSTGVFTVVGTGIYLFNIRLKSTNQVTSGASTSEVYLNIYKNNVVASSIASNYFAASQTNNVDLNASITLNLTSSDQITFKVFGSTSSVPSFSINTSNSYMCVDRVGF